MEHKTRVVMVGCGGISDAWVRAAKEMPDVDIVGFVDIVQEAAAKRATSYGSHTAVVSTDFLRTLDEVKPEAVFDCTIPSAHTQVTLDALAHGCHVLGEKPLADSMADARQMVEAAQKAGKIFAVIQNRRYDPNIRHLQAFLASGRLGPLTTVNCDFYLGAHFGGFRDHMEHVLLMDMAIHTFDAARLITRADPVAVYCKEWNPSGSWYDHDASAVAVFEMTGGLVYTYRGSWCSEGLNTTWESSWHLIGEKGSASWDGADEFHAEVVTKGGDFRSELAAVSIPAHDVGTKTGGHAGVIREFIHCIRSGGTPETIASDNIKSLAMVFAAIESAKLGRRVEITL